MQLGADEKAKYPFLADAGEYLRGMGFTLEQFGSDPDLARFLERAVHRIDVAVNGGVYRTSERGSEAMEIFSFLLAVVLLKLGGAATLTRRFALAEARRAERFLEQDLASPHGEQLATRLMSELFSVEVQKREGLFAIAVRDYLEHSVKFHEREWKLVNRRVEGGLVLLGAHEAVRLVRQQLGSYITSRIQSAGMPPMVGGFEEPVRRLRAMAEKFAVPAAETTEFPPCIKHAIAVLEKGENLPHYGRLMLATYLLGKGQTEDQIAPLFKNAPDYNERTTRYQLGHLSGGPDGQTRYTCPSCDKLKSRDLCFAVPECDGIINPMQFGRRRR